MIDYGFNYHAKDIFFFLHTCFQKAFFADISKDNQDSPATVTGIIYNPIGNTDTSFMEAGFFRQKG